jgi:hypothetical protein
MSQVSPRAMKSLIVFLAFAGILASASMVGQPAWGILPYVGLVLCGGMLGVLWKVEG